MHACWIRLWQKSPHFNHTNNIDPQVLQKSFVKLTASFPKHLTGAYMVLHTQHAPLCHHLHHIGKTPLQYCPHCPGINETVPHLLLDCPSYCHERHALVTTLGCKASSFPFLLSDPSATQHLICFLNTTQCFRKTFGELPIPSPPQIDAISCLAPRQTPSMACCTM
ncbi:hypothetical protein BDR06DRAFT_892565 [Suillus hirtellus]|nr:hypothetical protein BDR06DRAFT_892565 [Suillus hirtellus]